MADTVPISTHPPAIKVGGRRLSTTSRPTKPHSAHIDPTSPTDNDPNPTDYPRPTTHAQAQADTDHPPLHHNEDEHPKKDKKTHDIPTPAAQRKLDMTRPTRDFASSNKGYNGAGIRIAQPAGKGLGV